MIQASSMRRLGKVMTFAGVASILASVMGLVSPLMAHAVTQTTDSTRTYRWDSNHTADHSYNYDVLHDLAITVSQTSNLTHQGIVLSWSGAPVTSSGEYANNFMQVMQCWGDEGAPTPDQCQFGSPSSAIESQIGNGVGARSLSTDADPNQVYSSDLRIPPTPDNPFLRVYSYPFKHVNGTRTFNYQQFFTANTTNEVTAARTGSDGTGQLTFEVQTSLEAPHLGCGADIAQSDGTSYPRSCWLVVVPRTTVNVDGSLGSTNAGGRIWGSPFSASNWRDRIVIPLGFQSVSQACPIGQHERRLVGSEAVSNAITSWQPALCGSGTTYGYSLIGDDEARTQIVGQAEGASRLGFMSEPLTSEQSQSKPMLYAPVTQSAIVVAYSIDYSLYRDAPIYAKNGTKLTNLVLNARLIAKLLTQSYRVDVPGRASSEPALATNPFSLNKDPEFIALNPDFQYWTEGYPSGLFVALGSSDLNKHVWEWLRADADAKAFLQGEADPYGMKINPAYLALGLAGGAVPVSFPKADLTTALSTSELDEPGYGTLDMRPYYNDLNETAYRVLRADGNNKTNWDITKVPARYVAIPAQPAGERFVLAITDSSSAARYGLDTAALVNRAGEAVSPTTGAITKAINARAKSSVAGVSVPDFSKQTAGAYPLAEVAYAALNVCDADAQSRSDYAKFLSYVAGAGQTPGLDVGNLPLGYLPLTSAQRAIDKSVASTLRSTSEIQALCPSAAPTLLDTSLSDGAATTVETNPVRAAELNGPRTYEDGNPVFTTFLTAGGLAVGIPMIIIGPILIRRSTIVRV